MEGGGGRQHYYMYSTEVEGGNKLEIFREIVRKLKKSKDLKDIIGKSISREAEWHKFQLRSSFQ